MSVGAARDGRMTMRIVFANLVERILSLPAGPSGRIQDSTVLAMRTFEATAHPWIRADKEFIKELDEAGKLSGDAQTLARWTAVLAGLMRAQMLDKANAPYDHVGGDEGGDESET